MLLIPAETDETKPLITQTIDISDDLSRQLRTMSYLLHPPLLDELGLASALAWYVEGFSQRSSTGVELEVSRELDPLPEDLELAVFRVVQECLTNIHRHSGSPSAKIRLKRTPEGVHLEVIDAGHGIPPDRMQEGKIIQGLSIMGIHERMRQLGGSLEVKSLDRGTTVVATLLLG